MNSWDEFRYNKQILEKVNEAVDIFNDPKSSDMLQAMAHGMIMMEDIICEEYRKKRQCLPIQTKERWDKQLGCML